MEKELICFCKNVPKQAVEAAIAAGAKNLKDVQNATSACTGNECEQLNPKGICCSGDIVELLPKGKPNCSCCKH